MKNNIHMVARGVTDPRTRPVSFASLESRKGQYDATQMKAAMRPTDSR